MYTEHETWLEVKVTVVVDSEASTQVLLGHKDSDKVIVDITRTLEQKTISELTDKAIQDYMEKNR